VAGPAWFGHSRNYLPVLVPKAEVPVGTAAGDEITVISRSLDNNYLVADIG
jgi:hypothetical protein